MSAIDTDGARIAYARTGTGPAVILIQGAGVIGEGWRPQIDGLADRFDLIRFDNRGIGASVLAGGPLTIEAMAGDALAILDAEGIASCHVAGHSMGGLIAQELALRAPSRVRSLALLCTFARGAQAARVTPPIVNTAIRMRVGTRAMRRDAFLGLVLPQDYLRGVDRAALAPVFGHDLAAQPSIALRQVRAMAPYDRSADLSAVNVPTLVVSAAQDRLARPEYGRELAARIPGARFCEIPAAGHAATIQCAEAVNRLLAGHWHDADALKRR